MAAMARSGRVLLQRMSRLRTLSGAQPLGAYLSLFNNTVTRVETECLRSHSKTTSIREFASKPEDEEEEQETHDDFKPKRKPDLSDPEKVHEILDSVRWNLYPTAGY
eukprot:gb/GECG01002083.1/.p1 GENE.gb/GECG01002083.1/~~gb/GECG01002083.1/.p1  ORF type:complete len:107 (+),score=15.19 gb/GECG01002083.1/:1-321(+)